MNYYVLVPFTSFLMEAFTCVYILAQGSKNKINKAYLFLAGGVAIWALAHMIIWTHESDTVALYILKFSPMWSMAIGFWFLNFTYALINKKRDVVYYLVLIVLLITIIISITTNMYAKDVLTTVWGRQMVHGTIFLPAVFFDVTLPMLYGFYLIIRYKKTIADPQVNKQLALIITGIALSLGIGLVLDVIVPFVLGFSNFIQLGTWVFLFHTIFIFIAITKYKFFKIGIQEAASDLFSNVKDGIILMDSQDKIIQFNEAVEDILCLKNEESGDYDINEVNLTNIINNYSYRDEYKEYETTFQQNGKLKYLSLSQSSIIENKETIGKMLIIRDVTESKKAELEIKDKNKKISESINYAYRIQEAILPDEARLQKIFPDSFVLYKIKDIVSGDFPWLLQKGDDVFVTAVDCTGHGVPGAMLSMIGHFLLKEIIESKNIHQPGSILTHLHTGVNLTLNQDVNLESKDGMDVAFCKINLKKMELEYAGAHRPLLHLSQGKLNEIKGDRLPIGGMQYSLKGKKMVFTNHIIKFRKGDAIFFYSDGYPDQLGGPEKRKLMNHPVREIILQNKDKPMTEVGKIFEKTFDDWKGDNKQTDDTIFIGIRF